MIDRRWTGRGGKKRGWKFFQDGEGTRVRVLGLVLVNRSPILLRGSIDSPIKDDLFPFRLGSVAERRTRSSPRRYFETEPRNVESIPTSCSSCTHYPTELSLSLWRSVKDTASLGKTETSERARNPAHPRSVRWFAPKQTFTTSKRHTKACKRSVISASGPRTSRSPNETLISGASRR